MGKDNDFSAFIKSGHVLYYFSCVVYSRLKAFGKKWENKTHGKISHSTVVMPQAHQSNGLTILKSGPIALISKVEWKSSDFEIRHIYNQIARLIV